MAYNLLGLRTSVRSKLKDSSYSASVIDGAINDAQLEIADLYLWSYFQKLVSGALTIDEHTYEQQSDHQTTAKLVILDPDTPTSNWDITKYYKPWEEFFNSFPAPDLLDSSQPVYWTEYGNQIYFNCPASKAYLMRQFYQKIPTELTGDNDIPELPINFREALILGATYRCEEERENHDIAAVLQNRFNDRVSDLMTRLANTTLTGPDTVVMPGMRSRDD